MNPAYALWIGRLLPWMLLLVAVGFAFSRVSDPIRLLTLYRQWAEIGILALGMTAILLSGGIDLSVGSIVTLSGMVMALGWQRLGLPMPVAMGLALLAGTIAGSVNAALVAWGIAPLVATLATMSCFAGLSMAIADGERIAGFPDSLTFWGQEAFLGVPTQLWVLGVLLLVFASFIHQTRFGRYIYAIGDNRMAATFAGVPVRRMESALYIIMGTLAGLVGILFTARGGAAVPNPPVGLELQAIACVVLGGTSVTGGFGSLGRTLLGIAVLAHVTIGLGLLSGTQFRLGSWAWSFDANTRSILVGLLVVTVAIANERLKPATRSR